VPMSTDGFSRRQTLEGKPFAYPNSRQRSE
jgi:hypothetical protein